MNVNEIKKDRKTRTKTKFLCTNYGCGQLISFNDMDEHNEKCKFLLVPCYIDDGDQVSGSIKLLGYDTYSGKCEYCHNIVEYPHTKHIYVSIFQPSQCTNFYTKCPNCGQEDVKIVDHFGVCRLKPRQCDLIKLGCKGWILKNIDKCSKLDTHNELIEREIKELNLCLYGLDFENINQEYQSKLNDLDNLNKIISNIKLAFKNQKYHFQIPRNGKMIWKIENALKVLDQDNFKVSSPLFTDDFGYKLCLKIYLKGEGAGKNTHLSIFYHILQGDYDHLLPWPFRRDVTIILHNKAGQGSRKIETFKACEKMEASQNSQQSNYVAIGNPKFIGLSDLRNDGYIVDNSLFIEICVDKKTFL